MASSLPRASWLLLWAISLGTAVAAPPQAARALAPGQPDFVEHRRALEQRLLEADAVGVALTRVHNALGALLSVPASHACDSDLARSLAARSRPLGAAYRDAAQAARAEATRVRTLLFAPTLVPLLQTQDKASAEQLLQRSMQHVRQYQEVLAWQERYVEPLLRTCPVALQPAEGLPGAGPALPDQEPAVALVGVGGGKICPGSLPANGQVLVLHSAQACYGGLSCRCDPRPVLPGAVLGPTSVSP